MHAYACLCTYAHVCVRHVHTRILACFKVRPECVAGFVLERLGSAYMSNRLGKLSREHLESKSLVLFFEGKHAKSKDDELLRALQLAYKHFNCEDGLGHFEVIYITWGPRSPTRDTALQRGPF